MLLAIDIGGTTAKLGLCDREGRIHARSEVSVAFDHYKTPILATVRAAAADFLRAQNAAIEGIGVSATGQIDTATGVVAGTNGSIDNYEGAAIKQVLEVAFHVPVWVLNDANAALLGECTYGAGKGYKDVLMVTLGTGVGGGLFLNGQLYGGSRGLAGELGHFTLYQDGVRCSCGKRGCYECYASTAALAKRAGTQDGRAVFLAAADGDERMGRILDEWLSDVAAGLTGLVHIFNPALVLIGGGVSAQEERVIRPLRTKLLSGVMPRFAERLELKRALLGNDAGMVGALKFWLEREG